MPRACHSQKARRAKGRPRWRREGARRCSIAETEWLGGEKRSLDLSEAFLEAGAHDRLQTFSDAFVVTRCISSACTNGAGIGVSCQPVQTSKHYRYEDRGRRQSRMQASGVTTTGCQSRTYCTSQRSSDPELCVLDLRPCTPVQ
jgi:hypothetical protein